MIFVKLLAMGKKVKIHAFCYKPNICQLINKTLETQKYEFTCTETKNFFDEKNLDYLNQSFDCIIIDREIEEELKEKIKNKYKGLPMICLPSLDSDIPDSCIKYISEPLRLSELVRTLDEIFQEEKG